MQWIWASCRLFCKKRKKVANSPKPLMPALGEKMSIDERIDDLNENYLKRNRVFILGAGFSASAGIPLTASLLKLAMDKFELECNGIYQRVEGYARESAERYDDEPLDFSKIEFSELCTFLEFIELREYGGGERWKNAGSREKLALKCYLAKTIAQHTPSQERVPELYKAFASQLHEMDIVISFNWDGLLEQAILSVGKTYTYNWEDEEAIKLNKLHGSVNWRLGEPERLGEPINTLEWQSMGFTKGMMETEIYHTNELLNYPMWSNYQPLGEVEPFLVLPGYGKAFDVRSNAVLWYKPEFAFATTHDVYIIGLSLAPDDYFIRSYFLSNLPYIQSYSGIQGRTVYIINPDDRAVDNYRFVTDVGGAQIIQEKFCMKHVDHMREKIEFA